MTISAKHTKTSAVADTGDASLIQPSDWNADHALTMTGPALIGRAASGNGAAQEITLGAGLTLSGGALNTAPGAAVTTIPDTTKKSLLLLNEDTAAPERITASAFLAALGQSATDLPAATALTGGTILTGTNPQTGAEERFTLSELASAISGLIGNSTPAVAAAVTLTGPTTGVTGTASTNFTVGVSPLGSTITSTLTVTPSDGGAGGTFAPTSVSLTTAAPAATFTYTPASTGAKTISVSNGGSLTNPASITYTATAAPVYATGLTLSGPASGTVSTASTAFTVGLTPGGSTLSSSVTVTPNDGGAGGTFSPTSLTLSSGTLSGTFTYTPSTTGARTIGLTNNGSLTNPTGVSYTSNAAAGASAYTLTGPSSGGTGSASTAFTVTATGTLASPVAVTPSDSSGGGTFSPTSVTLAAGANTSATFTYTPATDGAKTISVTNSGGLTNPSSLTYTASTSTTYTITSNTGTAAAAVKTNYDAAGATSYAVSGVGTVKGMASTALLNTQYFDVQTSPGAVNAASCIFWWSNNSELVAPSVTFAAGTANTGGNTGNSKAMTFTPNGSGYFAIGSLYLYAEIGAGPYYLKYKPVDGAIGLVSATGVTLTNT